MSGTTITAEERALWLSEAQPKNIDYYEPIDFELDKRIRKLIGAIEQSEKELAGADAEIAELRDELEDSRGTEKDAPNILCAIARLVGVYEHCQELGDDMGTMSLDAVQGLLAEKQKAEAENARLTKMVDWLASHTADICASVYQESFDMHWWNPADWKDAARRAVAAVEETCQK